MITLLWATLTRPVEIKGQKQILFYPQPSNVSRQSFNQLMKTADTIRGIGCCMADRLAQKKTKEEKKGLDKSTRSVVITVQIIELFTLRFLTVKLNCGREGRYEGLKVESSS